MIYTYFFLEMGSLMTSSSAAGPIQISKFPEPCWSGMTLQAASVTEMLHSLEWRTLEQRRVDSRLCMIYKIRNCLLAVEEGDYLQRGTGRWQYQYRQIRADKDYTRFSFFPHRVIQWSKLISHICTADSLESFQTEVSKIKHSRLI